MKVGLFASLLAMALFAPCISGSERHCCSQCGCFDVQKVRRMVPEIKQEPKITWSCECEEICLPGPSRYCGKTTVADCQARGGERCETVWEPTCGRLVTRRKLKKTTVMVEKQVMKCVVDTVCCQCGAACTP